LNINEVVMRCKDKIVFITGASSGIGKACAEQFAAAGAHVILCARRAEKLKVLAENLTKQFSIKTLPLVLDLTKTDKLEKAFQALPDFWKNIDILVNNAGMALGYDKLFTGNIADWEKVIDLNIKSVLAVTRFIVPHMITRQTGHIINLGSMSSRYVYATGGIYCATKFAVRAMTQTLKVELLGTPIRVSLINPGFVRTEFFDVRFAGDPAKVEELFANFSPLSAEDVADAVVYCATRPLNVDIIELNLVPTYQAPGVAIHRGEPLKK
jgi:3-hydroxy acid dehydrogenase/malonic semialdehyde reductase